MPMIDADGCLLNVSVEGRDGGPTLMLSNSLGCGLQMWEPQMKALTQLFRVVRYDRRGHGKSSVPPGPYSMERFGRDVLAILDDLNIEKVHWCGLSMGGMVGQWLGANAPERLGKIILSNTACYYPDPANWNRKKGSTLHRRLDRTIGFAWNDSPLPDIECRRGRMINTCWTIPHLRFPLSVNQIVMHGVVICSFVESQTDL